MTHLKFKKYTKDMVDPSQRLFSRYLLHNVGATLAVVQNLCCTHAKTMASATV